MAQVINTNILSLNAQRNLTNSSGALQTSLQRLSSGLRINSAKDDAAGLAISERFSTQIRGLNQAVRNANDGISLAQVAEGALGEVNNNLQRIRELAVQARNATNSVDDRAALQAEVKQRIDEIQRVASQTEFNGTKLLDGNFSEQVFQVGANQGQTISIDSIASAQTDSLGEWKFGEATGSITALAGNVSDQGTDDFGWAALSFDVVVGEEKTTISIDANDGSATAYADAAAAQDGLAIEIRDQVNASFAGAAELDGDDSTKVNVSLDAEFAFADTGGTDLAAGSFATTTNEQVAHTGFATQTVETATDADKMIVAMDAALTAVNDARAQLGAVQNRFESVVANLSSASENLSASRSRILDADFAAETAQLTRAQILQQAGISVLSQANASPQSVLSLLQ